MGVRMDHGRRRRFHFILFLSFLVLYSVNIWIVADDRPWRSPIRDPLAADEEWVGAVHIHTRYSDGGGTIDEVASIAADVGLDFVIISDHNTLYENPMAHRLLHETLQGTSGFAGLRVDRHDGG